MADRTDRTDRVGYFMDEKIPHQGHSARTYMRKGGHAPSLADAREAAVDDLAAAEAVLAERDTKLAEAQRTLKEAIAARDKAYNARQEARYDVKERQRHLAWVCSTDAPDEP